MNLIAVILLQTLGISVDLEKLMDRSKLEVENELGAPTYVQWFSPENTTSCQCEKVFYLNRNISIIYIDGTAQIVTISNNLKLVNLSSPRIKVYHKWKNISIVKASLHVKEEHCCGKV